MRRTRATNCLPSLPPRPCSAELETNGPFPFSGALQREGSWPVRAHPSPLIAPQGLRRPAAAGEEDGSGSSLPSGSGATLAEESPVTNNLSLRCLRPGPASAGAGPLRTKATPPLVAGVPPTPKRVLDPYLLLTSPRGRGLLQRPRKQCRGPRPLPFSQPYHLQQPRRVPRHCRADSEPQSTCARARRRCSRPYPAILPRPVSAPSRSLPPRLPARRLTPRAGSRAHPTPRLHACSITVPEAGLQASPVPELFEYANEGLSTNQ